MNQVKKNLGNKMLWFTKQCGDVVSIRLIAFRIQNTFPKYRIFILVFCPLLQWNLSPGAIQNLSEKDPQGDPFIMGSDITWVIWKVTWLAGLLWTQSSFLHCIIWFNSVCRSWPKFYLNSAPLSQYRPRYPRILYHWASSAELYIFYFEAGSQ